jgi:enoyl-CoA hydratase/carnithine racemase
MPEVELTRSDGVLTITLNRPDVLNALNKAVHDGIFAALEQAAAEPAIRAVVITGAGRGFCVGQDLQEFSSGARDVAGNLRQNYHRNVLAIRALQKPVIAAVNGPAVGIGVTMTLPMDIRLAAQSARFGFVFTRRGLVPEAASTWFLPRVVGISRAMEWVATGRVFGAAEALDGGLVSRVVPDGEVLPAALEIGREICDNTAPVAVAAAKQLLWSMLGAPTPWQAHALDSATIHALGQGADVAEGVRSFLDKRPPQFPGTVSEDYPGFLPPWPERPASLP